MISASPITSTDLDSLSQLDATATPGPWFVRTLDDELCTGAITVSTKPGYEDVGSMRSGDWPGDEVVAVCLIQHPPYVVPADDRYEENAALIAAMRTVLPELIRLARLGLTVR